MHFDEVQNSTDRSGSSQAGSSIRNRNRRPLVYRDKLTSKLRFFAVGKTNFRSYFEIPADSHCRLRRSTRRKASQRKIPLSCQFRCPLRLQDLPNRHDLAPEKYHLAEPRACRIPNSPIARGTSLMTVTSVIIFIDYLFQIFQITA